MKTLQKNMQQLFIFILFFCTSALITQAQTMGNQNYAEGNRVYDNNYKQTFDLPKAVFDDDSTLIIEVNALINVKADSYVAILALSQKGETAQECHSLLAERIENFKQRLTVMGVSESQIFEDFIAQVPTYTFEVEKKVFSKTANEIPIGFELKKNLHIVFQDPKIIDKIMLIASEYDIYELVKVDYIVSNTQNYYAQLREAAAKAVEQKLQHYGMLGIDVSPTTVQYVTFAEDWQSFYPSENYASYTAYSPAVAQGDYKNVTTIAKSPTFYYNRLGYEQYDIVLNPEVLEPAVQFAYNLKVKYSLKKRN